ncbi:hypothetical protein [Terrisporobacter mayombei]|uniref:Uncharacterized protein n=1 Tax=Terrisporobacter mayombei TaxID=1541 RepID=A0ABY9Q8U6_9FIRM|nr:hypothetical protein [Terrisporobacter mayombei]MCC3870397.1 hypothetical protein [Terrisporobacter mayombei]WMT83649.1 hypothetical protein TEMA_41700 [Terrisporobacter mayombei]
MFKYTEQDYEITKKIRLKGVKSVEKDRVSKLHVIDKKYLKIYGRMGMDITLDLNKFCMYREDESIIICNQNVYISISPISITYPNLDAEITRHDVSYRMVNKIIGKKDGYIQGVLNGKGDINLSTALKLKESLFSHLDMGYLFSNNLTF